jgi:hypothetical protein
MQKTIKVIIIAVAVGGISTLVEHEPEDYPTPSPIAE